MRTLGKILLGSLAFIGFMVVALTGFGIYAVMNAEDFAAPRPTPPDKMALAVDLDRPFVEGPTGRRFDGFALRRSTTHEDALVAIRRAKDDPRVTALIATISEQAHGLAQTQDLRDVIAEFRASGKPTMIFAETIGEGTAATGAYYLASTFGEIWVQPSGTVGLAGIGIEQPFFKDLLDRFGVKASVIQRKEYKSAMENLTNAAISPANREALEALLGSFYGQFVDGIARSRELTPDAVRGLIDRGPLLAQEALDAKLIDRIAYRDEFKVASEEKAGTDEMVGLDRYLAFPPPEDKPEPTKRIAVIHAIGQIARGENGGPFGQHDGIASETMSRAILDAAEDEDIDAILMRIDSPGGSYVASDTIWREVVRAKAKKPVIVSMGNTAASGGYYIAMAADRLFAQPATVTGSIGVIFGKLVFEGAFDKLDINWDSVAFGESAGMFSAVRDFSENDLARLNQMIDAAYADFTTKAAQGRGKDVADLERAARGRIWTGADALKAGLIDELGGYSRAIDYTKERIGLNATDPVWLVPFPPVEDPWKALLKALEEGDLPFGIVNFVATLARWSATVAPLMEEAESMRATGVRAYADPVAVR
ncbi:MAG: signal peptide peptidase SppA [Rhodospirillaceae bacterium]|nr:signal peptide peptidase SppA [Rhodospirillaceae bacterium]